MICFSQTHGCFTKLGCGDLFWPSRLENSIELVKSKPRHNWAVAALLLADGRLCFIYLDYKLITLKIFMIFRRQRGKKGLRLHLHGNPLEDKLLLLGASDSPASHLALIVLWHWPSPWSFGGDPTLPPTLTHTGWLLHPLYTFLVTPFPASCIFDSMQDSGSSGNLYSDLNY